MNEDKETKLLEEIQVLENEENINYELVENKRKEVYIIRQIKMEGVKIRSKARWINDGENVTNTFVIWRTETILVNAWIVYEKKTEI